VIFGIEKAQAVVYFRNLTAVFSPLEISGCDKHKKGQTCFIYYAGDSAIFTTAGV